MPQQVSSSKIWMCGHVFGIILASSFQNKVNIFFEVTNKGHFQIGSDNNLLFHFI